MVSVTRWTFGLVCLGALAGAAHATVLYKSIGPHGVLQFSDTPPENGTIIEARVVPDPESQQVAMADPLDDPATDDAEIARADTEVDLAEHALALARRPPWSPHEGLRLANPSRNPSDAQRVDYYERRLAIAHRALVEALQHRSR